MADLDDLVESVSWQSLRQEDSILYPRQIAILLSLVGLENSLPNSLHTRGNGTPSVRRCFAIFDQFHRECLLGEYLSSLVLCSPVISFPIEYRA
jgi:hypothetical protein